MYIKKILIFIFFVIYFAQSINSYNVVEYHLRTSFIIFNNNDNIIGYKIRFHDFNLPIYKDTHIYILKNGNFLQLIHNPPSYYLDLQFQKNRFKKNKLNKIEDVGLEISYKLMINIKEEIYHFILFGDTTYIYLKDDNGNIKRNEEAFEYLITKIPDIKDFIEIMACDDKYFILNFACVFSRKEFKEKFNLNEKKYHFIESFQNFSEIEKSLGFDCSIYRYYTPREEKWPIYIF